VSKLIAVVTMSFITPAIVRELYKESLGAHIKCENCGVREPLDAEFSRCGSCRTTPYCSRECQVKHWKASHKKNCQNHGNAEANKQISSLTRKLDKFSCTFGPMMTMAFSMQLAFDHLDDSTVSPRTHVIMVRLSVLPENVPAFKPRVKIESIQLKLMTDLPEGHLRNLQDAFRHYPRSTKGMAYFLEYPILKEHYFLRPILVSYQDNPFKHSKMKLKKMTASQRSKLRLVVLDGWVEAINDMVLKKRPELFAAANGH
jgi:hypothetical protein